MLQILNVFAIITASRITITLCCNAFDECRLINVRKSSRNIPLCMTKNLHQLNGDHKARDKCHRVVTNLKCNASNKRKDVGSDEIEQFANITAMESQN